MFSFCDTEKRVLRKIGINYALDFCCVGEYVLTDTYFMSFPNFEYFRLTEPSHGFLMLENKPVGVLVGSKCFDLQMNARPILFDETLKINFF